MESGGASFRSRSRWASDRCWTGGCVCRTSSMIFLLPWCFARWVSGMWSAIVAAVFSFFAFDFFFTDPRYQFTISQPHEFLSLLVFLVVAIIPGCSPGGCANSPRACARGRRPLQSLVRIFAQALERGQARRCSLGRRRPCAEKRSTRNASCCSCRTKASCACPPPGRRSINWTRERPAPRAGHSKKPNRPDGGQPLCRMCRFQFRPLTTTRGVVAVCGIEPKKPEEPLSAADGTNADLDPRTDGDRDRSILAGRRIGQGGGVSRRTKSCARRFLSSLSPRSPHAARVDHRRRDELAPARRQDDARRPPRPSRFDRGGVRTSVSRSSSNLLDMSRIESGALAPRQRLVDVADVVRNAVERSRKTFPRSKPRSASRGILPLIRGDANLLSQILFNLLDNAHKYGGDPARSFYARREGADVVITVTDEGPGVKPTDLERIFEKFYRSGRVGWPQGRNRPRPIDLPRTRRGDGRNDRRAKPRHSKSAAHASLCAFPPRATATRNGGMSGPRVLVVDDEPQIQRVLRPALTASGYEVIEGDDRARRAEGNRRLRA